jgi:hypothetical protein
MQNKIDIRFGSAFVSEIEEAAAELTMVMLSDTSATAVSNVSAAEWDIQANSPTSQL